MGLFEFGRSVVAIVRKVPVLSPARETQASADCLPSLRSSARSIPKGFQPIAGGERSVTTGSRTPEPPYPEGIAALRVVDSRASAGIPSGYGSLLEREPVVFAALDQRLWSATPAGNAVKDLLTRPPARFVPPLPRERRGFRRVRVAGERVG